MPKETRKLGQDRPAPLPAFQGVQAAKIPDANLAVSLDTILAAQQNNPPAVTPSPPSPPVSNSSPEFQDVPVDLIDRSPFQPRLEITENELDLLSTSIAVAGKVNRPILLRTKDNGRFELIGGERRWRSVVSLGWPVIPARIVDVDDAEAEMLALSDNEGQEGLTDYERGRAYVRILERNQGLSQRSLASRIGVSHTSVTRCVALAKLPKVCIDYLDLHPRLLGSKLAYEFASAAEKNPDLVLEAMQRIDQEDISQEQALRWISQVLAERSGTPANTQGKRSHSVRFAGGQEGSVQVGKADIRIKVPKGVEIEKIEQAILQLLQTSI
ncbi:ParB/RepB/Spo0J family partition protein [Aquipseudomonas alcaligenes]|uniref:Chromosome partitioning protein, ParB family n=1 Tax=Aquipseudomonas alcaligenes TaxID=43263 RepID=A0A1N6X8Q3_AQUAC|nr:ParB/RepB/Spo0J family partition protein [Pseudomonas alcaligenes]SIQ98735.1 chromosome partitioning protein, ParB family [Pseudomonas alcaligenes]